VPGIKVEVGAGNAANVVQDASLKGGMWGAYDIARIIRDTGWQPRPGEVAFHDYMDWIVANEGTEGK
jgi:hypothetical protein